MPSSNKHILIAVAVAVLVVGGLVAYQKSNSQPQPVPSSTQNTTERQTYQNTTHGYSLKYPTDLQYIEYSPDNVTFGHVAGESIAGIVEVSIVTVAGEPNQSLIDAVANQLQMFCAADGPSTTFSCTGVEQMQPFATESGTDGYALYLRGELTNLQTKQTETIGKGPYFVIPLQTSANSSKVLVVHPPLNQSAAEADAVSIRAVADSLVTDGVPTTNPITEYIRDHITELSPQKAQLGGTFYVTNLEAHGGAGTVAYEDGHNAYIADFTYSVDQAGSVTVNTFTIRP